jgi:AGZA family xanthine/uracil permease-like MFS transporter
MGVIFLEGAVITVLVVLGLREAIMNAVPLALKRAIGVGIGLFILFIGFVNAGLIVSPQGGVPPVAFVFPAKAGPFVAIAGLLLTIALSVLRVRGALLIAIVATTALALVVGVSTVPSQITTPLNFSNFFQLDPLQAFTRLGIAVAVLTIFAIMLSDFFDTMGTVVGIAGEAGLLDKDGKLPGVNRVLLVDSLAAAAGGAASSSSNTTYIESAAGVSEGGRTGLTAVVVGALFVLSLFFSSWAGVVPTEATAPILVIVGYFMMRTVKDINFTDPAIGIPALLTIIVQPFTFSITNGVGAGFIAYTVIRLLQGKFREVHPLMFVVSGVFAWYFVRGLLA